MSWEDITVEEYTRVSNLLADEAEEGTDEEGPFVDCLNDCEKHFGPKDKMSEVIAHIKECMG